MSTSTERPVAAHIAHAGSALVTWQRERIALRLSHAGPTGLTARTLVSYCLWPIDTVESVLAGMLELGTIVARPKDNDAAPTFYALVP